MKKISTCLLVSGGLGYALLEHISAKSEVVLHSVFTDKKSDEIISFCNEKNIACFVGNPRNESSVEFRSKIDERPDILLSVNYLFLIEHDLINYPKKIDINVHGSLLPKYRGRTPHVWSIINNEKETGITAHLITGECDKGAIIIQKRIPLERDDTGGSVLLKFKKIYPVIIDEVITGVQNDSLQIEEQDETRATYYPKRTPNDGEINWNWQRERIYNWVRAMAPPEYPGAFFFEKNKKVVVKKAELSDLGFSPETKNGQILSHKENEYLIKVQNGCIKLFEYKMVEK